MNKSSTGRRCLIVLAIATYSMTISSCGSSKKSSSDTAADAPQGATIALSGTLNLVSAATASMSLLGTPAPLALTSSTYTLSCTSLGSSSTTVTPVTSAIGADGSFSLSMAAAKTALGCAVLNSAGSEVATFSFKDPTQKDFAGNAKVNQRAGVKADLALGTLSADLASAQVSVDMSKFAAQLGTATISAPFFFDGAWVIAQAATVPTGYTTPCTVAEQNAAHQQNGSTACNGPGVGEKIWIKTLKGTDTTSGSTKYGIMVWSSEAAFQACGSKLGFTYAAGKTNAGIDLSGSGVTEGTFTWGTGWTDGWKNTTSATAQFSDMNCLPATFTNATSGATFDAFKCSDAQGNYSINLGGGCFTTASSTPVQVSNWSSITNQAYTQSTDSKSGLPKSVMTGTYNGAGVTCVSINQNYNADGSLYTGKNGIQPTALVTQGQLCSTVDATTSAGALAQMRCYSNYYGQNSNKSSADSTCLRKIRMDWTATDPTKFVDNSGPQTATGQDVLALLNYVDNDTATFTNDEIDFQGVQSNNMWVDCKMRSAFTMTLRRQSDTVATGEFVQTMKLIDTDKAACVAGYGTSPQTTKSFMQFNKQ